jgi:hypothetical protein
MSESVRDVVMRGYVHVVNQHSGLLQSQIEELDRMGNIVFEILDRTSQAMSLKGKPKAVSNTDLITELRGLVEQFDHHQILRIQDNSSKTRLSILSYSLAWDCLKIAEQTDNLMSVFEDPFRPPQTETDEELSGTGATA